MTIKSAVVCSLFSVSIFMFALSATPAAAQQEKKDADTIIIMMGRAYILNGRGKHAEAIALAKDAVELTEKTLGPDHPEVARNLDTLARWYQNFADYANAESLASRALAIREKALGPEHPDVAQTLDTLGSLYFAKGNYAKAESLYRRALVIQEKTLGPEDRAIGLTLQGLANVYRSTGNDEEADRLMRRAEPIRDKEEARMRKELGTERTEPNKDVSLNVRAQKLRQEIAEKEKKMGPEHPYLVTALAYLAVLYQLMHDYAKVEEPLRRMLAIQEKALGLDHPDVAQSLQQLARLFSFDMGDYAKAEPLYRRALGIREKALGPDHPDVAQSLNDLAGLEAAQKEYGAAFGSYKKGLAIEERHIQNVFTFLLEEPKLKFIESISWTNQAFLSLIHQHLSAEREAVRDGLELVLRRKGVVFDAQSRAREALQGRLSEAARKDWDQLSSLRSELARLLLNKLNKPATMTTDAYKDKLASLQRQIEETEKRLAGESALVAKELKQRTITVEAVAKDLPKNAALVEFVKIRDFDFPRGKWAPSWRYLAFVLTGAGDVTLVDLGEANALENQVQRVLQDIKVSMQSRNIKILKKPDGAQPNQPSTQSLKTFYAQMWAPLQQALGSADKVVVSPDGLLSLVPFAALLDGDGRALVENYRLAYVSNGRELIGSAGAPIQPDSDLLLVANPAFGKRVQGIVTAAASVRSRDFRGVFDPLPGTEREAKEIPPLVSDRGGKRNVLVESDATEGSVKSAHSPRILHLATHGFFLQDKEFDPCGETRGLTVIKKEALEGIPLCEKSRGVTMVKTENTPPPKRYENPLVRSGLAFAGANHASEITEGDDGILTALEITGMDLYGTELVVLSACDTGVGEVKTGEGVFGLRRAFALAGAKNLMMSLWPVSDDVTATQMKAFYKNLQTLPPAEALRQAQLETIKELKAKNNGVAPPGLWAPFILQGGQALGQ